MNQRLELVSPEPWEDPEFARRPWSNLRAKQQVRRLRAPIGALGLILALIWAGLLLDPMIAGMALGAILALALTMGMLLGAMSLGIIGSGLFAVGDRVFSWLRRGSRWPED
jgi:hypothetical protein